MHAQSPVTAKASAHDQFPIIRQGMYHVNYHYYYEITNARYHMTDSDPVVDRTHRKFIVADPCALIQAYLQSNGCGLFGFLW